MYAKSLTIVCYNLTLVTLTICFELLESYKRKRNKPFFLFFLLKISFAINF